MGKKLTKIVSRGSRHLRRRLQPDRKSPAVLL